MLTNYIDIKNEIAHIEEKIENLQMRRISPRMSVINDMPKAPSFTNDKMDNDLIKLEKLEEKYREILGDLYEEQIRVEDAMKKLESIERDVIRYRYFDGWQWADIRKKLNLSQRTMFRIHKRALDKLCITKG